MACRKLCFTIQEKHSIDFIVTEKHSIDFTLAECFKIIEGEHYEGPYVVIPKAFDNTILQTKNKVMDDNVEVVEIPYDETSNTYGTTVVIAS